MAIRFRAKFHSPKVEYKKISRELHDKVRYMRYSEAVQYLDDVWNPSEYTQ